MASRTRAHEDQPIHARLRCLAGMAECRHVVKYEAAIVVHPLDPFGVDAARGNQERPLVFATYLHARATTRVGLVEWVIDTECWRRPPFARPCKTLRLAG